MKGVFRVWVLFRVISRSNSRIHKGQFEVSGCGMTVCLSSSLGRSSFASSCSSNSVLSQTLDASSRTVFSQSAASSRPVSLRSSPSTSSDKRRQRAARRKGIRVIRLGRRKSAVRETAQGGENALREGLSHTFGVRHAVPGFFSLSLVFHGIDDSTQSVVLFVSQLISPMKSLKHWHSGTSQGLYNGVTSSLGSLWKRMTGHSSSEKWARIHFASLYWWVCRTSPKKSRVRSGTRRAKKGSS